MKNLFKTYEFSLFLLLIVVWVIVGLINPAFFSFLTLLDMIRNQTIFIILALGLLPVLIYGGLDTSFVAIAALASYPIHIYLLGIDYQGGAWMYFLPALVIGLVVGLIEGFLVHKFKLNIFNMTLGMNMLIYGGIRFFIGSFENMTMTPALRGWNAKFLFTVKNAASIESGLHVAFLIILAVAIPMHLFLKYTVIGRGIYAFGSDRSVAIRTGFNIKRITYVVMALLGVIGGLGGITFSAMRTGFFSDLLIKKPMEVIAAVFLGGASVTGGKGSVVGTILGAILIGLINQALVYLGISTKWFDALIGLVFIAYATFQAFSTRISR